MLWCIYTGVNRIYDFDTSNTSMTITLNMACNTFMYTSLFGLSESSNITIFEDLGGKIIEVKVAEKGFFCFFPRFDLNYLQNKIFK